MLPYIRNYLFPVAEPPLHPAGDFSINWDTVHFLIASGTSVPQVQAIADAIEEKLAEAGLQFLHKEGYREARWVLLDYGVFVAHIFVNEERQFYNLEQLWGSAPARVYED